MSNSQDYDDRRTYRRTVALDASNMGTDFAQRVILPGSNNDEPLPFHQIQYSGYQKPALPQNDSATTPTPYNWVLPARAVILRIWNVQPMSGTTPTFDIDLPAYGSLGAVNIVTGADASTVGQVLANPAFDKIQTISRPIRYTLSGTGLSLSETPVILLELVPQNYIWK